MSNDTHFKNVKTVRSEQICLFLLHRLYNLLDKVYFVFGKSVRFVKLRVDLGDWATLVDDSCLVADWFLENYKTTAPKRTSAGM